MNEMEIKEQIRTWIAGKNTKVSLDEIQLDTPILEKKIISSLQVMDLILYLESLKKGAISLDNMKPCSFTDINTIYKSFFAA
jgi:acyl carrier protein